MTQQQTPEETTGERLLRVWRVIQTPVVLLALLGLLLLGGKWGWDRVTEPVPKYYDPCVETPVQGGQLQSSQIIVQVLNGSDQRGKAGDVSQQLKSMGFKSGVGGNTDQKYAETTITGYSPDSPEVQLVAKHFKNAKVVGNGRQDHGVEVVIGADYDSMVSNAPSSLEYSAPTICLPKPPATQ
ncbi:LytR C-terminal domain-containing protein [Granulicoccus phenolivorans]|uniref:LytR C-terminal domain-containing protein n=1 Tax=Granulicoccus phenolivorans TaxID=266854 RepID=UPI00040AE0A0|nr:LytR C-terminal domain-containing protein [Granulicoccus phenolivorans]